MPSRYPTTEEEASARKAPRSFFRVSCGHMLFLSSAYALPIPNNRGRSFCSQGSQKLLPGIVRAYAVLKFRICPPKPQQWGRSFCSHSSQKLLPGLVWAYAVFEFRICPPKHMLFYKIGNYLLKRYIWLSGPEPFPRSSISASAPER